jgi:hypothetical protein
MGFLILALIAKITPNTPNNTKFKVYLKDSGYKIIDHHLTTDAFKEGDTYYNKEEYINLLKKKYNSDKIEVIHYSISISKTG